MKQFQSGIIIIIIFYTEWFYNQFNKPEHKKDASSHNNGIVFCGIKGMLKLTFCIENGNNYYPRVNIHTYIHTYIHK